MQTTQESAMQDTCLHLACTTTNNEYGMPDESWSEALAYPCGFDPMVRPEAMPETDVPMTDAKLRISIDVQGVINEHDRLRITHRFGVLLSAPLDYEIVGLPERGPSGLMFSLKKVTEIEPV
jgi:hypothetical protein